MLGVVVRCGKPRNRKCSASASGEYLLRTYIQLDALVVLMNMINYVNSPAKIKSCAVRVAILIY